MLGQKQLLCTVHRACVACTRAQAGKLRIGLAALSRWRGKEIEGDSRHVKLNSNQPDSTERQRPEQSKRRPLTATKRARVRKGASRSGTRLADVLQHRVEVLQHEERRPPLADPGDRDDASRGL